MKLYLIRHGQTMANVKYIYCGSTDLPLSEEGIEKLKKFHYAVPKDARFLTSGMLRTEQTLQILFGDREHGKDERFRELDFGVFEMHSYEELKERADYQAWISEDNEKNVTPSGESGEQMTKRVLEGLKELLEQQKDTVLITHGGVIAAIMAYLYPEENKNRFDWQPSPGCGYLITDNGYEILQGSNEGADHT